MEGNNFNEYETYKAIKVALSNYSNSEFSWQRDFNLIFDSSKSKDEEFDYIIWMKKFKYSSDKVYKVAYILLHDRCNEDFLINRIREFEKKYGFDDYCIIDVFDVFNGKEIKNKVNSFQFFQLLLDLSKYEGKFEMDGTYNEGYYTKRKVTNKFTANTNDSISLDTFLMGWADSITHYKTQIELFGETIRESYKTQILLLGDRGMGKSWAMKHFCKEQQKKHKIAPWIHAPAIYVNLRTISEDISGISNVFDAIIYHIVTKYDIGVFGEYAIWRLLLKTGNVILVLDGLDEMSREMTEEIMTKNLWEIKNIAHQIERLIITSRLNFFNSYKQIAEHFAYDAYLDKFLTHRQKNEPIRINKEESRNRKNFYVMELVPFEQEDNRSLLDKYKGGNAENYLSLGVELVKKYFDTAPAPNTIEYEIKELCKIPHFAKELTNLMGTNKLNLISIYEYSIRNVVIEYNIKYNRSIDSIHEIVNGRSKYTPIGSEEKFIILEEVAWYLLERDIKEFELKDFLRFIKIKTRYSYDIWINDLKTQTVLKLVEKTSAFDMQKYSFMTSGIHSFFVAKYLFRQLQENLKEGLKLIGRYHGTANIGKNILIFLKELLNDETELKESILQAVDELFLEEEPYSPFLRYLSDNLSKAGLNLDGIVLKDLDFWVHRPLLHKTSPYSRKMILISDGRPSYQPYIKAFFIGETEVTNNEYLEFTQSNEMADFEAEDYTGKYWDRFDENFKSERNPYRNILNNYHTINWIDEETSKRSDKLFDYKGDHPVVWVSWFAAAKFCNWLSRKEKLTPYYTFQMNEEIRSFNAVEIKDKDGEGYRLPTELEWVHVASEGKLTFYEHIGKWLHMKPILRYTECVNFWDLYEDDQQRKRECEDRCKKIENETLPVRNEGANILGVYGLMGNVREWTNDGNGDIIEKNQEMLVKGSGWLFGPDGFKFSFKNKLSAQSNMLDIGFRVARNLSKDERKTLDRAKTKVGQFSRKP